MRLPRSSAAVLALAACAAPVAPAAPSCPAGAIVVAAQAELARLAGCTALPGLTVRSGAALDASALRALAAISGDLVIGPTVAVDEVSLGALRTVGGAVRVVGNSLLRGVYLPRLESAGRIEIDGNPALTAITLPRLTAVRGALRVTDNAGLERIDLAALASIAGALVVTGAPALAAVEIDQLQRAGSVEIAAPNLAPEAIERLRAAAGR